MLNFPLAEMTPDKDDIMSMYKLLLSSDFGTWIWEPETDALFFNEPYMRMLGYTHHHFPFHISTWTTLIHPDDLTDTVSSQVRILEDSAFGDSFQSRYRLRTASGEYIWVLGRGFVVCRDETGKALRVCGMHVDMRTLDKTLEEVAIQHDRMWFALEAARDGLWDWNAVTGEVYFSPRYVTMLGYKPNEFPARVESWADNVHPDDLEATVQKQYEHIHNPDLGDLFECVYRFLAADGTYKWILGRGKVTRRNAAGIGTRVVGLHTDITELRNAQESLTALLHQDSLTRLYSRFFFDSSIRELQPADYPLSILFCDVDGLKIINDNLGHAAGDELLMSAASILRRCLPGNSVAARLGGDEFAVLLRNSSNEATTLLSRRVHEETDRWNAESGAVPVYIALGAVSTEKAVPIHKLLARADKAMRENKAAQRTRSHTALRQWIEKKTGQPVSLFDTRIHTVCTEG